MVFFLMEATFLEDELFQNKDRRPTFETGSPTQHQTFTFSTKLFLQNRYFSEELFFEII